MDLWTNVHTDRQTDRGKVCWVDELMDGRTDGMMDGGKRADFVQAISELVFHRILAFCC